MPFWVIFVDEHLNQIYGNTIEELDKPRLESGIAYPRTLITKEGKKIRVWPLSAMKSFGSISQKESEDLKCLSQRNYLYQ